MLYFLLFILFIAYVVINLYSLKRLNRNVSNKYNRSIIEIIKAQRNGTLSKKDRNEILRYIFTIVISVGLFGLLSAIIFFINFWINQKS